MDGSLTYNEFIVRLNNLPLPAKIQLNGGNTKEAAGELLAKRFGKQLKAANVNKQTAEASKKHQYQLPIQEAHEWMKMWQKCGKDAHSDHITRWSRQLGLACEYSTDVE